MSETVRPTETSTEGFQGISRSELGLIVQMGTSATSQCTWERRELLRKNTGAKVVKKLAQPLTGGHYHVFFDNYFSSGKLFEDLLEKGVYAGGTFRKGRKGVPDNIRYVKLGNSMPFVGKFSNKLDVYNLE